MAGGKLSPEFRPLAGRARREREPGALAAAERGGGSREPVRRVPTEEGWASTSTSTSNLGKSESLFSDGSWESRPSFPSYNGGLELEPHAPF